MSIELLLQKLNDFALSVDSYEYGLPLTEPHKAELVKLVQEFLTSQEKSQGATNANRSTATD